MASHHTPPTVPLEEMLAVAKAARALSSKLTECDPHIRDAYFIRAIHVGPYTGPTFGEEVEALRTALTNLDARN